MAFRRLSIVGVPAALFTFAQLSTAPRSLLNSFTYQLHRGFELSVAGQRCLSFRHCTHDGSQVSGRSSSPAETTSQSRWSSR